MKRLFYVIVFILMATCGRPVYAQDPMPSHFMGLGLGFQNSANQKASGWFDTCLLTTAKLYGCIATDYTNGTTSTRGEGHQVLFSIKSCSFFGTAGAGAATGGTGGVGGSFDAGGVIGCKVPQKLFRTVGMVAVFSGSWQKNNVVEAPDLGTAFKRFGQQSIWRFGAGKIW